MSELDNFLSIIEKLDDEVDGVTETITAMNDEISGVNDGISGLCEALENFQSTLENISVSEDEDGSDSGESSVSDMVSAVRDQWNQMGGIVKSNTGNIKDDFGLISEGIKGSFDSIKTSLAPMKNRVKDTFKSMNKNAQDSEKIVSKKISLAKGSLDKDVGKMNKSISRFIPKGMKGSLSKVSKGFGGIVGSLKGIGSGIVGQFSGLMSGFGGAIESLGGPIGIISSIGMKALSAIASNISAGFSRAMEMEGDERDIVNTIKSKNGESSKSAGDAYLDSLLDRASSTHFSTDETVNAGKTALDVSGGDADMANQLMNMAQNVSASRGISLEDAIDMISAKSEEVGTGNELTKAFSGDSDGMANYVMTTKEQLDSMKEIFDNTFTQIGDAINDFIGPMLLPITQWFMDNSGKISEFGDTLRNMFSKASEYMFPFQQGFLQGFGSLDNGIERLKEAFKLLWPIITGIMKSIWSVAGPILSIFARVFMFLGKVAGKIVGTAFVMMYNTLMGVWEKLKPFFDWIIGKLSWVGDIASALAKGIGKMFDLAEGKIFGEDDSTEEIEKGIQNVDKMTAVAPQAFEEQVKGYENVAEQSAGKPLSFEELVNESSNGDDLSFTNGYGPDTDFEMATSGGLDNELIQGIKDLLSSPREIKVVIEKLADKFTAFDESNINNLVTLIEEKLADTMLERGVLE